MKLLEPHETVLVGKWISLGDRVDADAAATRIDSLVTGHLERLAVSPDGWDVLFRDPADGRLWELTYPQSGAHGGGPPRLECVGEQTRRRYGV